jgi:hypothetical protein
VIGGHPIAFVELLDDCGDELLAVGAAYSCADLQEWFLVWFVTVDALDDALGFRHGDDPCSLRAKKNYSRS